MSKKDWGNATWFMMHTLAHKLRPEHSQFAPQIIKEFEQICRNLPCPYCAEHATEMFNRAKLDAVSDKESLKHFLFLFHNIVNRRTGKPQFSYEECNTKYEYAATMRIVRHFFAVMRSIRSHDRAMIFGFRRDQIMSRFTKFMKSNIHMFDV